jgi:hypothetical protein
VGPESAGVSGLSDEADLLLRVVENVALPLDRRIRAAQGLEELGEKGVRFRLVKALPRKDSALLGEMVAILGLIGDPGSLPALERLDADEAVPLSGMTRTQLSWAIEQCRKNRARPARGRATKGRDCDEGRSWTRCPFSFGRRHRRDKEACMKRVYFLLACLPIVGLPPRLPAADEPPAPEAPRAELVKLVEVLDALELTGVAGKPWVVVETGPEQTPREEPGWLVADGPDTLTLLDPDGYRREFARPAAGARRPPAGDDVGRAWRTQEADFAEFCGRFLEAGPPIPGPPGGGPGMLFRFQRDRDGLAGHAVTAARYAGWARIQGQDELALKLLAHADRTRQEFVSRYVWDDKGSLASFVADRLAGGYRSGLLAAGHRGTLRPDLLIRWRALARIPHHRFVVEAREMAGHYESLVAEDVAWREPSREARAGMAGPEKAAYWMHHLRDADLSQMANPGMCHVVAENDRLANFLVGRDPDAATPNPAMELKKLGKDALPLVVAHLDDARPTRCLGFWRSYEPSSYHLLRYGDCCQQIFESITGHPIYERATTSGYPIPDGKGAECKAEAERWLRDTAALAGERPAPQPAATPPAGRLWQAVGLGLLPPVLVLLALAWRAARRRA